MFIGVYFIGELKGSRGMIEQTYLTGESTNSKYNEMFKYVRKPPAPAWAEWKSFLFRNFLRNGHEIYPSLGAMQTI